MAKTAAAFVSVGEQNALMQQEQLEQKKSHMCSAVEQLNFIKKLCLTTRKKTEVLVPYVLPKNKKIN